MYSAPFLSICADCQSAHHYSQLARDDKESATFLIYVIQGMQFIITRGVDSFAREDYLCTEELGTSLFEIAQSLFALERTLILGAMALLNKKSEAQRAN